MSRAATLAYGSSVAAVFVAGCLAAIHATGGPPPFDHAAHAARDLACIDCHETAEKGASAGMPHVTMCWNCHEEGKEPEPIPSVISGFQFRSNRGEAVSKRPPSYADVRFSHERHAKAGVACASCHGQAQPSGASTPRLSMDACTSCHLKSGAKTDCASCHELQGRDTRPRNHAAGWEMAHGRVSRAPDKRAVMERCDACHARAGCDECHTTTQPKDHTGAFRVEAHGMAASMDRVRCAACHEQDTCESCHLAQPPRSHRAGFGSPQDGHCNGCHLPLAGSSCSTCHAGAPSHAMAPPKPPTISAHRGPTSMDQCLACHRTLSHPVAGHDCNFCHK